MSAFSRKEFREHLNREHPAPEHRHGRYRQRTRPYGDYLWHQDREKFEADYVEWRAKTIEAGKTAGKVIDLMDALKTSLAAR